ncbi:MAG TPA: NAD(P)/FAD-dependent oxidoreductase [Bryobacteraceae bacterium]|nr:NAD(P)/FAD-dependent oxidoreductase [Bryobacteraceae bacterium]
MARLRVLILGGGFGGLYAAKALRRADVDITLVDKRNFHLFQPLLYQVATGSLSPGEIASPLRSVLSRQKNTRVLLGDAVDLDPQRKVLILADGEVPYDVLVVATGARDAWFGHEEWAKYAAPLKTIEEATRVRHKILYAFEAAEREADPEKRREWLTFIVVGAGATGVELAGALGEIANDTLKHDFRSIDPTQARVILLDGAPRVLPPYPEDLSNEAERSLIRLGVRPRTGLRVTGIDESGVTVQHADGSEEHLRARTVIWAAGVRASAFGEVLENRAGAKLERGGRVLVNPDLSVPGYPDLFVIGDLAYTTDSNGKPLPGVAQVAMQQGGYVAQLIRKRVDGEEIGGPFRYFDRGDLAVIGRAAAVARIRGLHLSGFSAWLIWLFIHLMYIVEFSNRVLVFIHWGFLYLTFNRGARLITNEGSDDS